MASPLEAPAYQPPAEGVLEEEPQELQPTPAPVPEEEPLPPVEPLPAPPPVETLPPAPPPVRAIAGEPDPAAPGFQRVQVLRAAGFSNTEIEEDTRTEMQMLLSAGFTPDEVAIHYGNRQRDDSDFKRMVEASGLEQAIQSVPELQDPTLWEAFELGLQSSVAGLMFREDIPEAALAEDPGFHLELAQGLGALLLDLPIMIGAGTYTAPAGPVVSMAAAFAAPGAMRQLLMDTYSKGQVQNLDEFQERLGDTLIAMGKEGTIGAATGGAGKLARVGLGKPLERMAASIPGKLGGSTKGITEAAAAGSEVVAMVGAGGAVHGEVPEAKDFALAAITIGFLRAGHKGVTATRQGAGRVMQQRANARENARLSAKFRRIYVRTGLNPREVVEAARRDPTIIEDLSSVNIVVPRALQTQVEGVDPQLVRAAEIVAGRGEAKASTLTKEMPDLSRADADALLGELEQAGVIGPRPPLFAGDRRVLATSEKQAQEMVKPAIELERATEAGGETYFRADSTNTQQRGGLIPLTTDRSVAEGYATAGEGAVAAYTVEVKNPLDMSRDSQVVAGLDAEGDPWAEAIINHAREEGSFYFWYMTKPVPYGEAWSEILIPQLRRLGYDGLRYVDDPQTGPVLAVFGREQMKPATEPVPSERAPDLDLERSGDAARDTETFRFEDDFEEGVIHESVVPSEAALGRAELDAVITNPGPREVPAGFVEASVGSRDEAFEGGATAWSPYEEPLSALEDALYRHPDTSGHYTSQSSEAVYFDVDLPNSPHTVRVRIASHDVVYGNEPTVAVTFGGQDSDIRLPEGSLFSPEKVADLAVQKAKRLSAKLSAADSPAPTPRAEAPTEPWQMTREEFNEATTHARMIREVEAYRGTGAISSESVDALPSGKPRDGARFVEAGFRDSETGVTYRTGGIHNPDLLPSEVLIGEGMGKPSLEAGFFDKDGGFFTRAEAAQSPPSSIGDGSGRTHRKSVERALAEGKPVPPEVLADYPDLAPTPRAEAPAVAGLSPERQQLIDAEIASLRGRLETLGDGATQGQRSTIERDIRGLEYRSNPVREDGSIVVRPDPDGTGEGSGVFGGFLSKNNRSVDDPGPSLPDHAYRGMEKAEYDATVGAGMGVQSRGDYSMPGEGTSLAKDFATAENYVNFGRSHPATTGEPTYLVEVERGGELLPGMGGTDYLRLPPGQEVSPSKTRRVWEMQHEEGVGVVAREVAPTPRAEAQALAEPTVPVEEVPSREPPRPFEEESLPEQIADVRALILEAEARGEQQRVDLIGRLSALDERLQRETVEPGSGQPSQGGKDAMDVVLSHISVGEKPAKRGWSLSQFYTHWKDGNHPLRVLGKYMEGGKDTREAIENEYSLARLFQGTRGKADHFIQFSPFKFGTYERVGRPLVQILKPVRKNLDGIRSYMVASRRLELYERAKAKHSEEEMAAILEEVGDVPIAEARRVVEEFGPELAPIAKDLYEYQDHVLQYARDGGLITPEAYAMMTELNKNYVPFFRVMLEEGAAGGAPSGNSFFRINVEGSGLKIHDPIESIIKNTHSILHAVERNAISDAYINHVEKVAGQGGIEVSDLATRVKPRMKKTRLGADEMKKLANKLRDGDKLTEDQRAALEQETLDIFRPDTLLPGQNQIVRFKDGKREVWEVPPEIAEVLQITSHEEMNLLVKILSVPATTLRAGAVLSPRFMLANPVRDSIVSFIQSDSGYKAFADTLWGAAAVLGKTRLYQDWMRSGGAQSELVALDRVFKGSDVEGVLGGGSMLSSMRNVVRSPLEGLRVLSQMSEQMTRVGEFGRALHPEKGTLGLAKETGEDIAARLLGQEMPPREAAKGDIMEAGLRSRDVSLDFGRVGSRARAVNRLVAFLNASLEGTDKMLRTMKDHPTRTMLRGTALLTVPALILQATNQGEYGWSDPILDDEGNPTGRYKPSEHIPQWQRDMFFVFPTYAEDDDGNILLAPDGSGRPMTIWHRIPAGYGYGMIFKALPQRLWERIVNEDPHAFDDYMESLIASAAVPFVAQAAIPFVETWANRSLFTGAPQIPAHLEGVLPEFQATPRTTSISRLIGGFLSDLPFGASQFDLPIVGQLERSPVASPMVIDHTVRALTGGLGTTVIRQASRMLEDMGILPEPPGRMADTPSDVIGLGAFAVRTPSGGELSRKFWDRVKENDQVHRTVTLLQKQGRPLEAQKLMQKHAGSAYTASGAPIAVPGMVESIQKLTKMRAIFDLPIPGITPDERLAFDHQIKRIKLMLYRAGLDQFEAMSAMPTTPEEWVTPPLAPTEARVNP